MLLTTGRKAAILVGIVVFIVGSGTGVSFALWSIGASTAATVAAGTIGISANGVASSTLAGLANTQIGPGTSATTAVTVRDTGTLPITYSTTMANTQTPSTAVIGANIDYVVWVTAAVANCTAAAAVGATSWTGNLGAATATLGAGRSLAVGASEVLCVRTTVKTTAPALAGQSVSTVLTFTGSSV
ncbi:MAG TPA: hypothetical protein DCP11_13900 [Microbacteriaceae bacterium]|nr:hypothetical protein [Microbacteriaceae bacterium]